MNLRMDRRQPETILREVVPAFSAGWREGWRDWQDPVGAMITAIQGLYAAIQGLKR